MALQVRKRRVTDALNCGWRHRISAAAYVVGGGSAAVGVTSLVLVSSVLVVVLNRSFYGLLLRRQGVLGAALGVGLHGLHHLAAVASLPVGAAAGLWQSARSVPTTPAIAAGASADATLGS